MATPIIMPKFGQMTEESAIVEWRKKEGDKVAKGDILFTVETDKSVMDVESFEEGTLLKIIVPPGRNVPVQCTVGFLGQPGEAVPAVTPPGTAGVSPAFIDNRSSAPVSTGRSINTPLFPAPLNLPSVGGTLPPPASPAPLDAPFRISPRAAKLAKDCVIDPARIAGTGPAGRIVEKDVRAHLEAKG